MLPGGAVVADGTGGAMSGTGRGAARGEALVNAAVSGGGGVEPLRCVVMMTGQRRRQNRRHLGEMM